MVDALELLELLREAADRVADAVASLDDWSRPGPRPRQYACDLVADKAAVDYLRAVGCGVISEERLPAGLDREVVVVVDPMDGTGNAIRHVPPYGPSLCAFVGGRPVAAHVRNLASGDRYEAVDGAGATGSGTVGCPTGQRRLEGALISTSGEVGPADLLPHRRTLDAVAFALCEVAVGAVDGFVDFDDDHHRGWDYAGGLFVCREAGGSVGEAFDRELWWPVPTTGRAPVAAATDALLGELLAVRRSSPQGDASATSAGVR
jgi:myo-inositol-1(or 4)-monophosphatase